MSDSKGYEMSEAVDSSVMHGRAVIASALHAVMEECSYVQKTKRNDFHKYNYAGEADLLAVLRPSMVKHGLMLLPSGESFSPIDEHGNIHVAISYTLIHKDGHVWHEKLVAFGAGNDRSSKGTVGDKGLPKAITGANKGLLFKLFQIETGDDPEQDDNLRGGKNAAPQEPVGPSEDAIRMLIERARSYSDNLALKKWWDDQKPALAGYGIVNETGHPGVDAYARIFRAVTDQVAANKAPTTEAPKETNGKTFPMPLKGDDIPFMHEWR